MEDKQKEENLKKKLAEVVRSIHWSYAIFWSPSSNQPGVLEWGDGYYNGGIKTRRTILSNMEINGDDHTICQRSDQLRELFESLLSGNGNATTNQTRRPLAALSPEDLTNVEWFYMVCMSFVFNIGQGLPGRCLASGRTIWLSNAYHVDTRVFTRTLLAKSAGIKTVVCFPFLNGVIELGVTESVEEDLNLIHLVRDSLLGNSSPPPRDVFPLPEQGENMVLLSPSASSNAAELIQPLSDVFLFEHLSNVMENDQLSNNCVVPSMTSSECISQTLVTPEHLPPAPKTEVEQGRISVLYRPISEDLHYQSVLSSLFKKSDHGFLQQNLDKKSGFVGWKKGGNEKSEFREVSPQYMLKKILFEIPKMHSSHSIECKEDGVGKDELCKQEVPNTNHVLAERRRREKVNERFSTLRSLIPSISKADKISILDDTITYLKELEKRVEELESSNGSTGVDMKKKRKTIDIEERTSDNYAIASDLNNEGTKNKRKSKEINKCDEEKQSNRDSLVDNTITISMINEEILINISCLWRDSLLLQIIDAMSNLNLDSQSVHSSTLDGILSLKIQSKLKGSTTVSIEVITQTLLRVIRSN